jgi:hypothetical protein
MTLGDLPLAQTPVEVILRFPGEDGMVEMTDPRTLQSHKNGLTFKRSETGGIGERTHRFAFVIWVVPLGEEQYRLEDPWHTHPLKLTDKEEAIGGLAFRDVFLAERLADESLRFDRIAQKGNARRARKHARVLRLGDRQELEHKHHVRRRSGESSRRAPTIGGLGPA